MSLASTDSVKSVIPAENTYTQASQISMQTKTDKHEKTRQQEHRSCVDKQEGKVTECTL